MILAIDTATDQVSVAVFDGGTLRAEVWRGTNGNHSRHLPEALDVVLRDAGTTLEGISGIVVARGPGSFNGIRVGIAHGKGLAFGLGVPLVGVSTLDVVGLQAAQRVGGVWAVLPAGRGDVYQAAYCGLGESWRRETAYRRLPAESAAREYEDGVVLAGAGAECVAALIREAQREIVLAVAAGAVRRAGFLAELGSRYLAQGGMDQLYDLEPLYLRQSSAEETKAARDGE